MTSQERRVIHVDMDAFFAAIEQRDFPQYRNKPLIVGGSPESRGVVSTCSYEAREFGIHSAMPCFLAKKLCPQGIFVGGRYDVYSRVGEQIRAVFYRFTTDVEPMSLDEAYLDVTARTTSLSDALQLAKEIKDRIRKEVRLTSSAGVSYNKFLAKVASEMEKPDGLTLIDSKTAPRILAEMEIGKFHGIGRVTKERMHKLGIYNGSDLKKSNLNELVRYFGKAGVYYYNIARGIDNRRVETTRIRKSLGKERTFAKNLYDLEEMREVLRFLARDVAEELSKRNLKGKTLTLKIKYADFTLNTRGITVKEPIENQDYILELAVGLLEQHCSARQGVRLLGISVASFISDKEKRGTEQLVFDFF